MKPAAKHVCHTGLSHDADVAGQAAFRASFPAFPGLAGTGGGSISCLGLLLYGLFLGVLYMRELGVVGLRQWCGRLPGVQVSMSRPEMSFFPPALEIADLTVQPPNASEPLAFRNVRAGLTVFPLGISLDADIAGGGLAATVTPSSLWNPERLVVWSSLSGVGIEPLLRPFMGKRLSSRYGAASWRVPQPSTYPF